MIRLLMLTVCLFSAAVLADSEAKNTLDDPAEQLAITEVPALVMAGARKAKPDVYFKSAERMWLDDHQVYRLQGVLFKTEWDVYVQADGHILDIQSNKMDDD